MWRPLRRGELDHEALWLGVSLAALVLAWFWLRLGLLTPACVFHEVTGWACPGCGSTRCVRYALRGAWHAAWLVNPLMLTTLIGIALFDLYAVAVLALRLPRWRTGEVSPQTAMMVRAACVGMLGANWLWLVRSGV